MTATTAYPTKERVLEAVDALLAGETAVRIEDVHGVTASDVARVIEQENRAWTTGRVMIVLMDLEETGVLHGTKPRGRRTRFYRRVGN